MKAVQLPGGAGTVLLTGTDAENLDAEYLLKARHAFWIRYCKQKGWPTDATKLNIEQILEARAQPGWSAEQIRKDQQSFFVSYCKKKGWPTDPMALTPHQILEIRSAQEDALTKEC